MTIQKSSYSYEDLISCANGELFGEGNAKLPLPNMLMLDRITHIDSTGGEFNKGKIIAELDVKKDAWFFDCHFRGDPVMPGCLGLDAMWQLVGFFLGWSGLLGRGRALGCGEIKFKDQVLQENELVTYEIDVKKVIARKLALGVANATMFVDGKPIYEAKDLRVGLFQKN